MHIKVILKNDVFLQTGIALGQRHANAVTQLFDRCIRSLGLDMFLSVYEPVLKWRRHLKKNNYSTNINE